MQIRRGQWQPTLVLLPGKSHEQRSLVGCSPWGRKELGMTERQTLVTCVISKETKAQSLSYMMKVTQLMSS